MSKIMAEYIWVDGQKPTAALRSKTKILDNHVRKLEDLPEWGFDGSSTMQAEGHKSDCLLKPVFFIADPIRGGNNVLVMCEVFNADGSVHVSNTRAHLREVAHMYREAEAWFGIEQEYTLYKGNRPLGFPENGFPAAQGPYYCAVGSENIFGRELVEDHMKKCLEAGLHLSGINAEVMPGQWEFQVGPLPPLQMGDELWLARWLLHRLSENYGLSVSMHPKPHTDWNGAGAHTNFSTRRMRETAGINAIHEACEKLGMLHEAHIQVYGADNDKRLVGKYETASIHEFRYGVSDRGASIRIPMQTANEGRGYLEDRRPAANIDPYKVCSRIIETVCNGSVFDALTEADKQQSLKI